MKDDKKSYLLYNHLMKNHNKDDSKFDGLHEKVKHLTDQKKTKENFDNIRARRNSTSFDFNQNKSKPTGQ